VIGKESQESNPDFAHVTCHVPGGMPVTVKLPPATDHPFRVPTDIIAPIIGEPVTELVTIPVRVAAVGAETAPKMVIPVNINARIRRNRL
jgi:hypothetical protein